MLDITDKYVTKHKPRFQARIRKCSQQKSEVAAL